MDTSDREKIMGNINQLAEHTDYDRIMSEFIKKQILFDPMKEKIEKESNVEERKRRLWEKITHRGPEAFDRVCAVLRENECWDALSILKPSAYRPDTVHSLKRDNTPKYNPNAMDGKCFSYLKSNESDNLTPFTRELQLTDKTLIVKKSTVIGKHPLLDCYSMKSKNRGVLLLINIMNFIKPEDQRKGSERDCNDMIALFQAMDFTIFFYQDISSDQLDSTLNSLIRSDYLRKTDCFVMCLMSHGCGNKDSLITQIEFTNGSYQSSEYIINKFSNNDCVHLNQKPKLFIFPVCRGDSPDRERLIKRERVSHDGPGDYLKEPNTYATFSDILICYATVPGYRVHRQEESGSWYMQILIEIFAKFACDYTVEELLKRIDYQGTQLRRKGGFLQTASYENRGFNRALYFNVGLIADDK